ncbi:hypothetical protein GGF46_000743 [Coemansia sp. RSA 552]|nr:hypothetical protein GGF46_000743 [Coemansia sp. RSA 552]
MARMLGPAARSLNAGVVNNALTVRLGARARYASGVRVVTAKTGSSYEAPSSTAADESKKAAAPSKPPGAAAAKDLADQPPHAAGDLATSLFNSSEGYNGSNWSTSYQGMATEPFDARISEVLMAPVVESEVEIKPDGLLYLPEIKYRRILNRAFGPGGWGLVPRGAHSVSGNTLSREYALICLGRFISQARGEQDYFDEGGLATATEGCKSNALVRCCKDLGVASELWDPSFITQFKTKYCVEEWVTHAVRGSKKRMWRLKTRQWGYPWAKK